MKSIFLLVGLLFANSVFAQAPSPGRASPATPEGGTVPSSLKCNVVETLRDAAVESFKQRIYALSAEVSNQASGPQIVGTSRFAFGFAFEIMGCTACATSGTVHVPQITIQVTDTQSGATSMSIYQDIAVNTFTVGDRTLAFICSVK